MDRIDVVAALIFDRGRFMICRRPPHKARGLAWEFVGGKVEPGESKADALVRECREELDIEVEVGDIFAEVDHDYPDIHIHLTLFYAKIIAGAPKLSEHIALAYIAPEEIPNYEFCPADKEILALISARHGA
ncbi:MAG: (deoxy)nucleoside triphosphate pyrophosphohydrolase [Clostridia bacterium]|nr:(deoxy)nucleoside triphosphate pyrophosphohydrolase [Clostridia bacterium]